MEDNSVFFSVARIMQTPVLETKCISYHVHVFLSSSTKKDASLSNTILSMLILTVHPPSRSCC